MRHDKEKAFELRRAGKSYREIEAELKITRSTLSAWFANEEWSKHIRKTNNNISLQSNIERILKMNSARKIKLENKYRAEENEAIKEFDMYKNDPLFMAGLMLYAGEGDKKTRGTIRLSNSEFYLHLVFIRFSEKFLKIKKDRIKIWLLLYPDHDIDKCIEIWSNRLKIERQNFYKSQVIKGKEKLKKLQYGVGNSIILSTSLKNKILKWLVLCEENFV